MPRIIRRLARHLWLDDLTCQYSPDTPDYKHRVRFQVLTKYYSDELLGPFVNFQWVPGQVLYAISKRYPKWAISVDNITLCSPKTPRYYTYRTRNLTSIDHIQDIHEFCVQQGFTPVFIRDTVVNDCFWPEIAVDREVDALLLANFCTNIKV